MSIDLGTFFCQDFWDFQFKNFKIFLIILTLKITSLFRNYYFLILFELVCLKISIKSYFLFSFICDKSSLHRIQTGGNCLILGIPKALELTSIKIICSNKNIIWKYISFWEVSATWKITFDLFTDSSNKIYKNPVFVIWEKNFKRDFYTCNKWPSKNVDDLFYWRFRWGCQNQ